MKTIDRDNRYASVAADFCNTKGCLAKEWIETNDLCLPDIFGSRHVPVFPFQEPTVSAKNCSRFIRGEYDLEYAPIILPQGKPRSINAGPVQQSPGSCSSIIVTQPVSVQLDSRSEAGQDD